MFAFCERIDAAIILLFEAGFVQLSGLNVVQKEEDG